MDASTPTLVDCGLEKIRMKASADCDYGRKILTVSQSLGVPDLDLERPNARFRRMDSIDDETMFLIR